jgi:hypothetical protein
MFRFLNALAHFLLSITHSPAQESAYKDLGRNGQRPAITPEATYTPVSPAPARAHFFWRFSHASFTTFLEKHYLYRLICCHYLVNGEKL